MNTDTISAGVDNGTQAGLGRLAGLKWWGKVIAVIVGGVSTLATLIGIMSYFVDARVERAMIIEKLASIEKVVTENRAGISENKEAILANSAGIRAIRTTVEANSADIRAIRTTVEANHVDIMDNSVGIAENRTAIAHILKTSE